MTLTMSHLGSSENPSTCATLLPMTQVEPSSSEHPLVGQTIANSKYKILQLLGEGGMGCVYLGEQTLGSTKRKVAVKTLHKHLSHDQSIIARFEREVGTVAALEHPNTIQVFDFGKMEDGTLFIVMEYVQGRSVADILEKEGAMPPPRVENIMKQVVGSLEEAHNHGIVHRDLKPDNVVLCERAGQKDWVEVLDFGIAKRSSEHDPNEAKLTQQGMVLGTPPYMSPEQFTGQPVDVRSDIYALGVMAYEMLTGKLPWEANTAWEWASKHMTEPPIAIERQPLGAHVPEGMRQAIQRALAKNKDERFANVREFFNAFSASGPAPAVAAAGGHAGGTAMLGAPGGMPGPQSGPASDGGASPRVKTEMGTPAMGGGPPMDFGGPPPMAPAGGMGPGPNMGGGAPAVVPAGPTHTQEKKGPPMLIIGLGGLALLLFIGAGIGIAMKSKGKTTTTTSIDLGSATPSASAAPTDSSAAVNTDTPVQSAAPLDTSKVVINNNTNTSSSGGTTKPSAKPSAKPVPTPTPIKPEPPQCAQARAARTNGSPPNVVKALETQCRNNGGTP